MRTTICIALLFAAAGCKHSNGKGGWDSGVVAVKDMSIRPIALPDGFATCVTSTESIETLGADVIFLQDTSYSMDYNLKWTTVQQGLETFLQDPRFTGIGAGLQRFPIRDLCSVPEYQQLAVPVAPLPGNYAALKTELDSWRMAGGTPTVPAIQGVLEAAQTNATANPTRKQIVVLATDGIPDDSCGSGSDMGLPNDVQSVVSLVGAAYQSTPPITTFVIGVGADLTDLDSIAAAGGGLPKALLVDTTQDITAEFSSALDQIRKVAFSCDFVLPPAPEGLQIDPTDINVIFNDGSGGPTHTFVNVKNAAGCANAPATGWYYDDPIHPTKVTLCDQACDAVRSSAMGEVDLAFGCAIIVQ
jgi:hypothetical protein